MKANVEDDLVDVQGWAQEGNYLVVPDGQVIDDMDFRNMHTTMPIWSIGRRKSDGKILASYSGDLYMHPGFDCLWLR